MRFPYIPVTAKGPIPSLAGSLIRHRPIIAVHLTGPGGTWSVDGLLDTGSDETVFEEWVATLVGLDLSRALQRDIGLVGRVQPVHCKYVAVQLRVTDGLRDACEWTTLVGFTSTRLRYPLFGQAGFLTFFDADFRGAIPEVILRPNASFPGRITQRQPPP